MSRRMRWSLGVAGTVVLALLLLLYTPPGLELVGRLAAPLSGGQVHIEGLGGFFPGRLHVMRATVADREGVWLQVEDAALDWSALALLHNHIDIDSVSARRIVVLRRPLPPETESSGETPRIDIGHLSAPRIRLGTPMIGHAVTLAAGGSLHYVSMQDVTADLLVTRAQSEDRYRIAGGIQDGIARGNATIHEGADGILGRLVNLPGLGAVNLTAQASGNANANAIVFRLTAGPLTANGRGTIALAASRADIDVTLTAPAMTPRPGMSWQALAGDMHVHGRFDAPQVRGHLVLHAGRVAGASAQIVTLDASGDAGRVALEGAAERLILPGVDLLAGAPLHFAAQADLRNKTRPVHLALRHPLARLDAVAQTAGPLQAVADLTLPSLAPFGALAGTALAGDATLHATFGRQDSRMTMALNGALRMTGANLPARLLGRSNITLTAALENSDVTASHLTLEGAAAKADIEGTLRRKRLNYTLALDLTDLSRLAGTLQGSLALKGTANGPSDRIEVAANGDALMASRGFARQRLAIELKAAGLPALSQATLAVGGRLDGAPLSLRAAVTGNSTRHATLAAAWRSLNAKANLSLAANGALDGTAGLALMRLADLAALTGTGLSGAAEASATFHDRHGRTDARTEIRVSGLNAASVAVQAATASGTITDLTGKPHFDLALAASHVAAQGWNGDAQARLQGPLDRLAITLDAAFADATAAKLAAHGEARLDLPRAQLTLTTLDGGWRGLKLSLDAPATLRFADGLAVDRLAAHLGEGRIAAAGTLTPSLSLTASAEDIALADFASFAPGIGPQGAISAAADLRGTLAAPTGRATLRGQNMRAAFSPGGMPAAGFTVTAQLLGDHAALDARMDAGANAHLALAGRMPLKPDGPLALHAAGKADLALLDALTAASGRRIRGTLTLDGDAVGTLAAPRISGHGSLADGDIQDYAQGVRIAGIAATFSSDGARLALEQLTARAGPGTLSASGTVDLTASGMPVDMKLRLDKARPIVSDLMTADLSGALTLTGRVATAMTLAGNVQVLEASINLPQTFPPQVAVLNVRRRGQPAPPPQPQPQPKQSRIQLDLSVRTAGPIFVRGHGMDADMGGALRVGGTTTSPAVSGALRMNRGTFSLAGQTLNFTSGQVRFDGMGLRSRLDPSLDFTAQTVSGGVTATLAITGYASQPKIALTSTPALPQDEVVAHLLFQQSVKQLGPLQLASIAQAAAEMGGIGGGFNPLGSVRRTLGLDRLAVGSTQGGAGSAENQTTVEAGRYVMRDVYVGVKQNLSGGTQTQVQVDITRRLKAQATLSTGATTTTAQGNALQDNGSSVGLSYQFEY